ncbi:MAG: pyrroline-5-carboxylate reductase [Acidimicrobiales bacterium]
MTKLQMIGGGKMGQALLQGMLDADWATAEELAVVEVLADQRERLAKQYPSLTVIDRPLPKVDSVLAVKPHFVAEVCGSLRDPGRVLSIAAGVTIDTIESALPAGTPVVRAMPNTPALVGAGAAGLAGGSQAGPDDVEWASGILSSVGQVVVVVESALDAVTGISGSGPAYLFLMAEAMTDAGVAVGLSRDVAAVLAKQTIYGAGKMMMETGTDPVELRAGVTTPAGTTAAGLGAMEDHGFRAGVAAAVRAATQRSIELGKAD